MRRRLAVALATLLAAVGAPGAASALPLQSSDSLQLVTSLPNAGAIGADFAGRYMYVTGAGSGLTIYDIANPIAPVPVGTLPIPHFENENVSVRGGRAIISFDGGNPGFVVADVSDPAAPRLISGIIDVAAESGAGHTAACADARCHTAYIAGANPVAIVDITDPMAPKAAGSFGSEFVKSSHAIDPDQDGLMWVAGRNGTAAFDVADPRRPVELVNTSTEGKRIPSDCFAGVGSAEGCAGDRSEVNNFIHHNSQRVPNADAPATLRTGWSGARPTAPRARLRSPGRAARPTRCARRASSGSSGASSCACP